MARRRPRKKRRGIYLLPTLFTLGNLLGGCAALVMTAEGNYAVAAWCIVAAGVLDGLDGRIARLTGTTSDFGREFDSLADLVSFGLAPSFLTLFWALAPAGRPGWAVAFLYVVCAATRLARFNVDVGPHRRFFAGLPSPAGGGMVAAVVVAFPTLPQTELTAWVAAATLSTLALLMIGHVRYRSFKEIDLRNRRSTLLVLPLAASIALLIIEPRAVLLLLGAFYVLSGPAVYIVSLATGRARRDGEVMDESVGSPRG